MTYRIGEHARLRGAFVPDFHVSKGRPTITPSNDHTGMALLQLLLSVLLPSTWYIPGTFVYANGRGILPKLL